MRINTSAKGAACAEIRFNITMTFSLANDYSEGAHPRILRALSAVNTQQFPGYGSDALCSGAAHAIQNAIGVPEASVYFLTGGTQTNRTVISSLLHPYEGVLSAQSGHISTHEAGAIENSGHKVIPLPAPDGKLSAAIVRSYLEDFYSDANHAHMVKPGMVYISHPTEYGTLYSHEELEQLHAVTQRYGIPLYCDGARLAYGLAAAGTDVHLPDLARLCDVFYIGGTKCGALFGEAVVFCTIPTPAGFTTHVKMNGALLAKGWLLGVQFSELFSRDGGAADGSAASLNGEADDCAAPLDSEANDGEAFETSLDGAHPLDCSDHSDYTAVSEPAVSESATLYEQLGRHANQLAATIREALRQNGYREYFSNPTNQVFFELTRNQYAALSAFVDLSFWENIDAERVLVRACTSWATPAEHVGEFCRLLGDHS